MPVAEYWGRGSVRVSGVLVQPDIVEEGRGSIMWRRRRRSVRWRKRRRVDLSKLLKPVRLLLSTTAYPVHYHWMMVTLQLRILRVG